MPNDTPTSANTGTEPTPGATSPAEVFTDLTGLTVEVIVKELKRRAVAKGMTTAELLAEAEANWDSAEQEAEDLRNKQ